MIPLEQTIKDVETIYTCPNHGIITEEGCEIVDNDFNCPICGEPLDVDFFLTNCPVMVYQCQTHGTIEPNRVIQDDGLPFCPDCHRELDIVEKGATKDIETIYTCPNHGETLEKDLFYIDCIRYCQSCGEEVKEVIQ